MRAARAPSPPERRRTSTSSRPSSVRTRASSSTKISTRASRSRSQLRSTGVEPRALEDQALADARRASAGSASPRSPASSSRARRCAPVRELSDTAERVRETRDLTQRIDVDGSDELSRLASTFNAMLESLDEAAGRQRRLVQDASHELRTPLTSLRTNIELLASRGDELPPDDRKQLLHDVVDQLGEMTVADRRADRARARRRPGPGARGSAARPRRRGGDPAHDPQPP